MKDYGLCIGLLLGAVCIGIDFLASDDQKRPVPYPASVLVYTGRPEESFVKRPERPSAEELSAEKLSVRPPARLSLRRLDESFKRRPERSSSVRFIAEVDNRPPVEIRPGSASKVSVRTSLPVIAHEEPKKLSLKSSTRPCDHLLLFKDICLKSCPKLASIQDKICSIPSEIVGIKISEINFDFVVKVCAHLGNVDEVTKFVSEQGSLKREFLQQLEQELREIKPAFSFINFLPEEDQKLIMDRRREIGKIVRKHLLRFEVQERMTKLYENNFKEYLALATLLGCNIGALK